MDILGWDWGGKGGKLWECWKCSPCCGSSGIEPKQCLTCVGCWWCCGLCSMTKLCASAAGQDCALVNHCIPVWCCGFCAAVATRHNARVAAGAGKPAGDPLGLVGDCCTTCCCPCCSFCQILRGTDKDSWNLLPDLQKKKFPKVFVKPPVVLKGFVG
eukprot:TRINITY_DN2288_c0_g1_i1.p1 TRINITY_DN2288_c0_g1~~TRINITY_DN2288_c0_g1_i1.p1  ORF type:complete len:157 (+),score=19.15 TRINITY_DN2288_c0_g1_i1:221-691(+)